MQTHIDGRSPSQVKVGHREMPRMGKVQARSWFFIFGKASSMLPLIITSVSIAKCPCPTRWDASAHRIDIVLFAQIAPGRRNSALPCIPPGPLPVPMSPDHAPASSAVNHLLHHGCTLQFSRKSHPYCTHPARVARAGSISSLCWRWVAQLSSCRFLLAQS
jgi:hypothetical protein